MKKSVRSDILGKAGAATFALGVLCSAIIALPLAAGAQVAGGSMAGGGAPVVNSALSNDTPPPEVAQCIHRATDSRPSTNSDDKRLTVWLSVGQKAVAKVKASGYAIGDGAGTLKITVLRDGIPVAYSPEVEGSGKLSAGTAASVPLLPGRQHKFTAIPAVNNKTLGIFNLDVLVGATCQ